MKLTRIIGVLCLTFIAVMAAFPQQTSIVTPAFKNEWRSIAGNKPIDTKLYDELSTISVGADRKAFLKGQLPASQLNVWQIHIAYCLANFKYSPDEEAVVREASQLITLKLFVKGGDADPAAVALYHKVVEVFKAANDLALYKYTFEVPGNVEVISICPLKPIQARTEKASFTKVISQCNCTWAGGCDDWLPCGRPCVACKFVIACGLFDQFQCSGLCGACCNGDC